MDMNGFAHGGLCPTCPGGGMPATMMKPAVSGEVQIHAARKMPDAPMMTTPQAAPQKAVTIRNVEQMQKQQEAINSMPLRQTPGATLPATLPPALEGPALPRPDR